jgi:phage FluMu protein Com
LQVDETAAVVIDGFFWCARCKHVVEPGERQVAAWEDSVQGVLAKLKCPRCHRWEVIYRAPAVKQTREAWREKKVTFRKEPVSEERARELFENIRAVIGN